MLIEYDQQSLRIYRDSVKIISKLKIIGLKLIIYIKITVILTLRYKYMFINMCSLIIRLSACWEYVTEAICSHVTCSGSLLEFKVKSNGGSKRRAQQESWDAAREQGGEKSHAIEIYL